AAMVVPGHDDPGAVPTALAEAVYTARNFSLHLRMRTGELLQQQPALGLAPGALDLARALEQGEPDLSHAVGMYILAWRSDRRLLSALQQARRLALGTGDMATAAKIAHLEFHETRDPELLAAEAI